MAKQTQDRIIKRLRRENRVLRERVRQFIHGCGAHRPLSKEAEEYARRIREGKARHAK